MAQSAALARAERLSAQLKRVRESGKETTRRGVNAGATLAGAFVAGALEAKLPSVGGSTVGTPVIAGVAALGYGLLGLADKHSDAVVALGAGLLSGEARDLGRQYFSG